MEPFKSFCGASLADESSAFSIEATANYYLESAEIPANAKGGGPILLPLPGANSFGGAPATYPGRARGKLEFNSAAWAVSGTTFFYIAPNGTQTAFGTGLVDDGNPVTMCAGKPTPDIATGQIAVASGGELYVYSNGTFTHVPQSDSFFGADCVTWLDGYFVVIQRKYSQFQLSALNDALTWNGADVSGTLGQADKIQMGIADKEYLYLIGGKRGEIWYNQGGALFPMAIESGAFIENGIGANASLCQSNNSIYWLDNSARGGGSAVRSEGLITRRISTHALEWAWANKDPRKGRVYPTVADCITFSFIWNGHTFIAWIFPTADASWLYDATESDRAGYPIWTEWTFTDALGVQHACLARDHCYSYGKHIVGSGGADGAPGAVYQLDDSCYYDAPNPGTSFLGFPIVRDRIVRLPWAGGLRQILDRLEVVCQVGVGLDTGQGSAPLMLVRISRDGGKTWGRELTVAMGAGGLYQTRVILNRLGQYRDGAIWIRVSDPVFTAFVSATTAIRTCGS